MLADGMFRKHEIKALSMREFGEYARETPLNIIDLRIRTMSCETEEDVKLQNLPQMHIGLENARTRAMTERQEDNMEGQLSHIFCRDCVQECPNSHRLRRCLGLMSMSMLKKDTNDSLGG